MKIVNCLCSKLTVKPTEFDVYVFIVSGVILGRKQYVSHFQQKKWIPLKMKGKKVLFQNDPQNVGVTLYLADIDPRDVTN